MLESFPLRMRNSEKEIPDGGTTIVNRTSSPRDRRKLRRWIGRQHHRPYYRSFAARAITYNSLRDTIKHPSIARPCPFRLVASQIKSPMRGQRSRISITHEELDGWGTSGGRCRRRPVEGIISGGATHLDGDAGHDLQRQRHLEWLIVVALIDEAQRLRVR